MSSNSNKRKSFNLILLILIVLLIVILIILLSKILKDDTTDDQTNSTLQMEVTVENEISTYNPIDNLDDFQTIDSISTEESADSENLNSEQEILSTESTEETSTTQDVTINNHTYTLPNDIDFTKISTTELLLEYPNYYFEMEYSTGKQTFESLKSNTSLRSNLESNLNVTISGNIKTGTLKQLDIIACEILDNDKIGYLIITPLNDSEIIYAKIFNISDSSELVADLSDPLDSISAMKSYLKN